MKKERLTILVLLGILILLAGIAILGILNSKTTNTEPVRLYLPEGTSYDALCDSLDESKDTSKFGLRTKNRRQLTARS